MVGSPSIKQGRSANRKHTYFFFLPNVFFVVFSQLMREEGSKYHY